VPTCSADAAAVEADGRDGHAGRRPVRDRGAHREAEGSDPGCAGLGEIVARTDDVLFDLGDAKSVEQLLSATHVPGDTAASDARWYGCGAAAAYPVAHARAATSRCWV
jgi:hypothetical protein